MFLLQSLCGRGYIDAPASNEAIYLSIKPSLLSNELLIFLPLSGKDCNRRRATVGGGGGVPANFPEADSDKEAPPVNKKACASIRGTGFLGPE